MADKKISLVVLAKDKASGTFKDITGGLSPLTKALAAVGVAAGAVYTVFDKLIKPVAETGDKFNKMSQRVGVSVESLSALEHAAGLSGTSLDVLEKSLLRLSKNINDTADGTGEAKDAFEDLGIAATNADGSLRPTIDVMMDLSDSFSNMPDGTKKSAAAMDIFGKSGAALIPMLNAGRDGINEMMAEAERLGIVMSTDAAQDAADLIDSMARLDAVIKGLKLEMGSALIPTVTELVTILKDVIVWVRENEAALADWSESTIRMHPLIDAAWDIYEAWEWLVEIGDDLTSLDWSPTTDFFDDLVEPVVEVKDSLVEIVGAAWEWLDSVTELENIVGGVFDLAAGLLDTWADLHETVFKFVGIDMSPITNQVRDMGDDIRGVRDDAVDGTINLKAMADTKMGELKGEIDSVWQSASDLADITAYDLVLMSGLARAKADFSVSGSFFDPAKAMMPQYDKIINMKPAKTTPPRRSRGDGTARGGPSAEPAETSPWWVREDEDEIAWQAYEDRQAEFAALDRERRMNEYDLRISDLNSQMEEETALREQYGAEVLDVEAYYAEQIAAVKEEQAQAAWESIDKTIGTYKDMAGSIGQILGADVKDQAKIMIPFEAAQAASDFAKFLSTKDTSMLAASLAHLAAIKSWAQAAKGGASASASASSGGPGGGGGDRDVPGASSQALPAYQPALIVVDTGALADRASFELAEFTGELIDQINQGAARGANVEFT